MKNKPMDPQLLTLIFKWMEERSISVDVALTLMLDCQKTPVLTTTYTKLYYTSITNPGNSFITTATQHESKM
jgi:hypothetical protein